MPESPEIAIMSEFLNVELGHRHVTKIEKSPLSKNKCDLSPLEGKEWKVSTLSRGKEMMCIFTSGEETHKMKIGFSRIGSIELYDLDKIDQEAFDNRAMLRFYTHDRVYFLSDFTRYVIWRWASEWDVNRSPDIVREHKAWVDHLYKHRNIPYFKRPIFELLPDQRFFNGLGAFTKTEILARTRFSPFITLHEVLHDEVLRKDFFDVCKNTLETIEKMGGLQFAHWKNPFGVTMESLGNWIRCYTKYGNYYMKDSRGRKLWFQPRWEAEYMKWSTKNRKADDPKWFIKYEEQDNRVREKIYRKIKTKLKK